MIPRTLDAISKQDIAKHLISAGFTQQFRDNRTPATEAYVKEIDGHDVEIEFLTDDSTRGDREQNVRVAGIVAQALPYLKLSLGRTLGFETRLKLRGKVVSPGAWLFHKGLTFVRRNNVSKRFKDLYGIWYVTSQLGNFSEAAIEDSLRNWARK